MEDIKMIAEALNSLGGDALTAFVIYCISMVLSKLGLAVIICYTILKVVNANLDRK